MSSILDVIVGCCIILTSALEIWSQLLNSFYSFNFNATKMGAKYPSILVPVIILGMEVKHAFLLSINRNLRAISESMVGNSLHPFLLHRRCKVSYHRSTVSTVNTAEWITWYLQNIGAYKRRIMAAHQPSSWLDDL